MPYPFADMALYFFIYSFCGWLMETVLCSVAERRLVNRGFLGGPFCPIYGCAVLLMLVLLLPVRDGLDEPWKAVLVVFFSGTVLATLVEYAISWLMEKLFHARWWDYSHMRFNLNGRVHFGISLAWGGLATLFLYFVQPLFETLVSTLYAVNSRLPHIISWSLIAILAADTVISTMVALRIGNKLDQLEKWSELIRGYKEIIELPTKEEILHKIEGWYERLAEGGRKASDGIKSIIPLPELHVLSFDGLRSRLAEYANELRKRRDLMLSGTRYLQRRMLKAFPRMRRHGNPASLDEWQKQLQKEQKPDEAEKK